MPQDPDDPDAAPLSQPEPLLRRLRAANPSPMTGTGTNSYILGRGEVAIIDPGPDDPAHLAALMAALSPGERVAQIIVTHAHADHSGLARRLARGTGAPVLAFVAPLPGAVPGMGGGEGIDRGFAPDRALVDGATLSGPDWTLRVIHTPGHLADHICLAWGDRCFTGDHVMGWSSSVISPPEGDMGAYMSSLVRLQTGRWRRFYPGHGPAVEAPAERLAELAAHRRRRETEILSLLARAPQTPANLTAAIYHATPAHLHAAALRNVLAHLVDLEARDMIVPGPGPAPTAVYRLS